MIDLAPCPFCEGRNIYVELSGPSGLLRVYKAWAQCDDCEARGPVANDQIRNDAEDRAAVVWNNGAKPSYINKES